jgi:hypothetical protein
MAEADLDRSRFRVKVVIKAGSSKEPITSPEVFTRAEAEDMIKQIHDARTTGEQLQLEWLTASGKDVLAAYSEAAPEAIPPTLNELIVSLKAKGARFYDDAGNEIDPLASDSG